MPNGGFGQRDNTTTSEVHSPCSHKGFKVGHYSNSNFTGKKNPWKTIHVGHKTPITGNKTWCLICAFTNSYFDSHPAGNCATLDSHLSQSATVIKSQTNKTPNLLRDCKTGDKNTPSQKRTLVFLWPNIKPRKKPITWQYDLWTNFVAGNWTSFNFISVKYLNNTKKVYP